jgi:hypothetical protein
MLPPSAFKHALQHINRFCDILWISSSKTETVTCVMAWRISSLQIYFSYRMIGKVMKVNKGTEHGVCFVCSQCNCDSFTLSTNIVWSLISMAVCESSSCSGLFVLTSEYVTLALSGMIQQWIFIVKSFKRKKTYRMFIHAYSPEWVSTKSCVWKLVTEWWIMDSMCDQKRQHQRNVPTVLIEEKV